MLEYLQPKILGARLTNKSHQRNASHRRQKGSHLPHRSCLHDFSLLVICIPFSQEEKIAKNYHYHVSTSPARIHGESSNRWSARRILSRRHALTHRSCSAYQSGSFLCARRGLFSGFLLFLFNNYYY